MVYAVHDVIQLLAVVPLSVTIIGPGWAALSADLPDHTTDIDTQGVQYESAARHRAMSACRRPMLL
jgi:hypothetical protein